MENSELKKRVITGIILASAVILVLLLPSLSPAFLIVPRLVVAVIVLLAAYEFSRLSNGEQAPFSRAALTSIIFSLPTILCSFGVRWELCAMLTPTLVTAYIISLSTTSLDDLSSPVRDFFVGTFLIGLGGVALSQLSITPSALIWTIGVVAANDIASYFVGSKFGNLKLAPMVSPGKTVEGAAGGLIIGLFIGMLLSSLSESHGQVISALGAVWVILAAQIGDLAKSLLKRWRGVKDSGSILPGHGGILDRIDGLLGAAPVVLALRSIL